MSLSRNPEPITQDNTDVDTLSLAVLCKEACINSWMRGQLNKLTKLASITAQSRRTALIFTSCPVIHEEMHVSSCAVIRCSLKERSVERKWSTVPLKEKEVYKTDIILVYVFWHEVSLTAHHTQNMNAHAIPHYHQQMALKSHFVSTVNLTVGTLRDTVTATTLKANMQRTERAAGNIWFGEWNNDGRIIMQHNALEPSTHRGR